jgi:hypothetical protein
MYRSIMGGAAFALVALSGCSWHGGDVSGTVRIGGKLATSGVVVIEDERGRSAIGTIHKDGTYTVIGPPKGFCKVMLRQSPPVSEVGPSMPDGKSTPSEPAFPIPLKYANIKSTDIEITVTDSAQTFNIERDDKLDFSPSPGGAPGGSNVASGGAGRPQGSSPKAPGTGKPAGPGMPAGSGMPGMPKK